MATLRRDPAELLRALFSAFPLPPHGAESATPSLMSGEVGILLAAERILPDARHEARLAQRIAENIPDPANGLFWAAPGTGLAALFLHEWTGEGRFRDLAVRSFEQLLARFCEDATTGCRIWTQRLHGDVVRYIGGAHGFAGNVHALLRASALFAPERLDEIRREAARTAVATAVIRDDAVNWPALVEEMDRIDARWKGLVQWCHGAPGVVIGLAAIPPGLDPRLDEVLVAGGELVHRAGPPRKGPGLCHGTAGNGYALLKLHARTGDARWLARARGFAMHAIEQWKSQKNRHRMGRYGLWTGDLGLALYLSGCIREDAAMPGIDVL
jgi:lantibiotic modifying enzyme